MSGLGRGCCIGLFGGHSTVVWGICRRLGGGLGVIGLTDIGLKQGLYHPDVTVRQVQPFVEESVSVRETDCNRLFHDYLLRSLSHTGYVDARCQRQAIFGSRYRLLGHEAAVDGKYLHALVGGSGDDYLALAAGDGC